MRELNLFYNNADRLIDQGCLILIPVFIGVAPESCKNKGPALKYLSKKEGIIEVRQCLRYLLGRFDSRVVVFGDTNVLSCHRWCPDVPRLKPLRGPALCTGFNLSHNARAYGNVCIPCFYARVSIRDNG